VKRIVMVDVDGTVADMGKGIPGRRSPYDWERVAEDTPIDPVIRLVDTLRGAGFGIVWLSGRDEACRDVTWRWLLEHVAMADDPLFMRPAGDNRADDLVKVEIYRREIEGRYDVAWVIDDRAKVVRAWRELGLTCLQPAPGDF
jgi:hypothetical protein